MNIISWLIVGLIAGSAAKMITPQKEDDSWVSSLIIGIAGSTVGGFLGGIIGIRSSSFIGSTLIAIGGAVLVLYIWHKYLIK